MRKVGVFARFMVCSASRETCGCYPHGCEGRGIRFSPASFQNVCSNDISTGVPRQARGGRIFPSSAPSKEQQFIPGMECPGLSCSLLCKYLSIQVFVVIKYR